MADPLTTANAETAATPRDTGEEPCFFSPGDALFGCFHAPLGGGRSRGVVLCPPIDPEYVRAHRAFRQLAGRLARVGFPVLRFDYYGTGDSRGEAGEAWLPRWIEDIGVAVDALRARTGVRSVALVGLRFGATLAALAATARDDVEALVLWEPIVRGDAYLEHWREREARPLWRQREGIHEPRGQETELLGWPLDGARLAALAAVDLTALAAIPARHAFVLHGTADPALERLAARVAAAGAAVTREQLPSPAIWSTEGGALLPTAVLERITAWLDSTLR